jgi:hypothetical protein
LTKNLIVDRNDKNSQMQSDSLAISRFCHFLEERSCRFWLERELDQVLPVRRTKPDFFVIAENSVSLLVEIESFENERQALVALRQNSVISGLGHSDSRRISNAIQHACGQLKPYRDLSHPALVVIDDFRDVGMPTNLDILGLTLSEYFQPDEDRHHLSAVGWISGRQTMGFELRVFHNPHAHFPLPVNTFASQGDEHLRVTDGSFWEKFS